MPISIYMYYDTYCEDDFSSLVASAFIRQVNDVLHTHKNICRKKSSESCRIDWLLTRQSRCFDGDEKFLTTQKVRLVQILVKNLSNDKKILDKLKLVNLTTQSCQIDKFWPVFDDPTTRKICYSSVNRALIGRWNRGCNLNVSSHGVNSAFWLTLINDDQPLINFD